MAILIAKILHLISSEQNPRTLYLFQILIMHYPGQFSFSKKKLFPEYRNFLL